MRIIASIILSTMLCFIAFAQEASKDKVDAEAQEILDKVSIKYEAYKTIKSGFEMLVDLPETDDDEMQKGIFYLQGDSYKIEMDETTIITDAKTQWTHLKEVEEVQISDYEPEENGITPSEIFTIYKKDYSYYYNGKDEVEGNSYHTIDLTPNDKEQAFFKIRLWINSENDHIEQAKVFDKNGNKYIYKIIDFEPNVELAADFFSFDEKKHEEIEIIDLR